MVLWNYRVVELTVLVDMYLLVLESNSLESHG